MSFLTLGIKTNDKQGAGERRDKKWMQKNKMDKVKWRKWEKFLKNSPSSTSKFNASCTLAIVSKNNKENGNVLLSFEFTIQKLNYNNVFFYFIHCWKLKLVNHENPKPHKNIGFLILWRSGFNQGTLIF